MRKMTVLATVVLVCAALVLATVAAAAGPPAIQRWVMAGDGGQAASGPLLLRATAGQSAADASSAAGTALCAGFWCAGLPGSNVYLPLVLRS